jgi:hypothetical protein
MKPAILSHDEFIIQVLVNHAQAAHKREYIDRLDTIDFGLVELIRGFMREAARQSVISNAQECLENAIKRAEDTLQQKFSEKGIHLDLNPYWQDIRNSHKLIAQEITSLSQAIKVAKDTEKIAECQQGTTNNGVAYEVSQIGLLHSIEGLYLKPLSECRLNLDVLKRKNSLMSERFPLAIYRDEFEITIDDDGSIFVSTDNFPSGLIHKAWEQIIALADEIYRA